MSYIKHNNNILVDAQGKPLTADFGIIPTGTKTITANGTYDVSQYASALVSTTGMANAKEYSYYAQWDSVDHTIVSNDADLAAHRNDNRLIIFIYKYGQDSPGTVYNQSKLLFAYSGNNAVISGLSAYGAAVGHYIHPSTGAIVFYGPDVINQPPNTAAGYTGSERITIDANGTLKYSSISDGLNKMIKNCFYRVLVRWNP